MESRETLPSPIEADQPRTALAPMQDVTALPFMRLIAGYGAPDYFFTEYFRVRACSRLEPHILRSITENTTGRPVFAQLIGESLRDIKRTVEELKHFPIAGIDLNMGCPAPKIYKKNVGGGLLREPDRVERILDLLRQSIDGLFTVKMRIGFDGIAHFQHLLELINRYGVDMLSVHGRTVKEMYRSEVHYDLIRLAAASVDCPVLANGNITSARKAAWTLKFAGSAGVMIGRSAIRNPWIFQQIRDYFAGRPVFAPVLSDVRCYIEKLYRGLWVDNIEEHRHVNRTKKFLNFIGQGVDREGRFLHEVRRARTEVELFTICDRHLIDCGRADVLFADEPYSGVVARPNSEAPLAHSSCSDMPVDFR